LQRISLSDQAVEYLRQAISIGRWKVEMPSESELCRELHISRVTLRHALAELVREGWLTSVGRGSHHQIRKRVRTQRARSGRVVRVLSPYPLYSLGSIHHVILDTMRERLGSAGYRLEYEQQPALFSRHAPSHLKRLGALPDTAAWLILYSTQPMQHWFAECKIPCLLFGRPYGGVQLPCVYPDAPATGRHAAGLFYQRGHRDVVYLMAEFTSLNDQLTSEAFAREARRLGVNFQIVIHDREPSDLSQKLNYLLAARTRPTAFFSVCPEHCLTILCHLLNAGLRVPADASIIAGWDDEFLHFAIPKFACYKVSGVKLASKAAAMLLDLIKHGTGKLRRVPILPEFVPGETLGSTPKQALVLEKAES
jgi:DNA-binding LacI/PurR family transcriptional regulator